MEFKDFVPVIEIITIVVLGVFSFISLFDRNRKNTYQEIVGNLEKTVASMKLRMGEMELEITERKKEHQDSLQKIAHLTGENKTLMMILQGKDPYSSDYRSKSLKLLQNMLDEMKRHDEFVRKALPNIV